MVDTLSDTELKKLHNVVYLSDLHIGGFTSEYRLSNLVSEVPNSKEKTLVVAGDIAGSTSFDEYVKVLTSLSKEFKYVVTVLGNHDLYIDEISLAVKEGVSNLKDYLKIDIPNLYILNRDSVTLDGVRFSGCMNMYSLSDNYSKAMFRNIMNDSIYITNLSEDDITHLSSLDVMFLETLGKTDFIITHLPPFYPTNDLYSENPLFYNEVDYSKIDFSVWNYGHVHIKSEDCDIPKDKLFVCNPLGYPFEVSNVHIEGFNYES